MANSLLTINMITREAIRLWKNTNAFLQNIDTQYDDSFAQTGAKIGTSLRIRLPNDFTVRTGPAAQPQDTTEQSTTLVLATQQGVDISYSSVDRTMSLDDFSRRVLAPSVNNLAGTVAANIMSGSDGGIANIFANLDGASNIIKPTNETYLGAGAVLDNNSAPVANRKVVNSPITESRVVASLAGLLNPGGVIGRQYSTGRMYEALGFDWMKDQTVLIHTNGTAAQAGNSVFGAGQSGLSLTVNATVGTFALGDIIEIDNVLQVNRITKVSTGRKRQFVVTAAVAAGAVAIPIYPALISPVGGQPVQYQTVNSSPIDGAAVNPALGLAASAQYQKNFVYAPDAVTMATADLELPNGVHERARESFDGISMRMITAYNVGTDQFLTRLDILYGFLWVRPEWVCVVPDVV